MTDSAVRSAAGSSAAAGTALSVPAPTGTAAGDLVLVQLHINGQTTFVDNNGTTPFVTSTISDFEPNVGSGMTASIYSRRIIAGDPSTYNFTAGASGRWGATAVTISNPNPSTIYDVAIGSANTDAPGSSSANIPSVTTVTDKSIHLAIGMIDGGATLNADPAGYSFQVSTGGQAIRVASKVITPAGATGLLGMTASAADGVFGFSVVVKNNSGVIPSSGAYQQEQNTTDRYLLEDGSGVYLIEPWGQGGFFPGRLWGDLDGLGRFGFKDRLNG